MVNTSSNCHVHRSVGMRLAVPSLLDSRLKTVLQYLIRESFIERNTSSFELQTKDSNAILFHAAARNSLPFSEICDPQNRLDTSTYQKPFNDNWIILEAKHRSDI